MAVKINITKHFLVPKHTKLSEKEKEELLKKYKITLKELPRIKKDDPAITSLNAKSGDVIKIERESPTSKKAIFYRGVLTE